MCRTSKIITFLESLRQAGWFDLFESDIQALLIFDPLITLWGNFDAPYLKLLNDARVASACFYVRTCRRVRNSKKIATIRDFHLPGSFLCLSTRLYRQIRSVRKSCFRLIGYDWGASYTWCFKLAKRVYLPAKWVGHNPPLPDPGARWFVLNHDQSDHNTNPMEH